MRWNAPKSLSDEQVYAVTAYILNLNGIISASEEMSAQTLPKVRIPNRDGFMVIYRAARQFTAAPMAIAPRLLYQHASPLQSHAAAPLIVLMATRV